MTPEVLIECIERTLADTKPAASWSDADWSAALGRARGTLDTALAFAKAEARSGRVRDAATDYMDRHRT